MPDDEPPECEPFLDLDTPADRGDDVSHGDDWQRHVLQTDFDPGETVYHLFGWVDRLVVAAIWIGAILLSILVYGAIGWILW